MEASGRDKETLGLFRSRLQDFEDSLGSLGEFRRAWRSSEALESVYECLVGFGVVIQGSGESWRFSEHLGAFRSISLEQIRRFRETSVCVVLRR